MLDVSCFSLFFGSLSSWRTGTANAVMFPDVSESLRSADLQARALRTDTGGGGVVIVIPELSMALTVGGDRSSNVKMTKLPLEIHDTQDKGTGRKRKDDSLMGILFSRTSGSDGRVNDPNSFQLSHSTLSGGNMAAMWYSGGNILSFFNLDRNAFISTSFADVKVRSVRHLRSENDASEWLLRSEDDKNFVMSLNLDSPNSFTATLKEINYKSTNPESVGISSMLIVDVSESENRNINEKVDTSLWGGSGRTYSRKWNFDKEPSLDVWQRSNESGEPLMPIRSVSDSTTTFNILQTGQGKGGYEVFICALTYMMYVKMYYLGQFIILFLFLQLEIRSTTFWRSSKQLLGCVE